jgi:predicted metal-dependent phosphoesterase TrpH
MAGTWKVDLHMHTVHSKDCLTRVQALIDQARKIGLDKVAVTEHNNLDGALAAKALAPDLVIVGEEIKTTHGEIIGYYLTAPVPRGLSPQATIARLRDQGAFITIPHPLDSVRRSAMGRDAVLEVIDLVDALEVRNARCVRSQDNAAAAALAQEHGKLMTAGSDAHILAELGQCYVEVPPFADSAEGLRGALAQATVCGTESPFWPHLASTYAKWRKRFFPVTP